MVYFSHVVELYAKLLREDPTIDDCCNPLLCYGDQKHVRLELLGKFVVSFS